MRVTVSVFHALFLLCLLDVWVSLHAHTPLWCCGRSISRFQPYRGTGLGAREAVLTAECVLGLSRGRDTV